MSDAGQLGTWRGATLGWIVVTYQYFRNLETSVLVPDPVFLNLEIPLEAQILAVLLVLALFN